MKRRMDGIEREFWMWRLRLARVATLLPATVTTALSSFAVLLSHRLSLETGTPARPVSRLRAPRAGAAPTS